MTPIRTIVGLFNKTAAAQSAVEHLLEAGFAPDSIHLATADTLRAQHIEVPQEDAATDDFGHNIVQFFMEVFAGDYDDAWTHARATRPDSAVVTIQVASPDGADTARTLLHTYGAVDVYKQALTQPAQPAQPAIDEIIDLERDLARVRDDDELDDNGLTTH